MISENNSIDCDVVVIGSGPAGLTASLYLARDGYKVFNVTGEEPGGNLANIKLIENYPGVISSSGYDLYKIMMNQCLNVGVLFLEYNIVEKCTQDDDGIYYSFLDDERIIKSKSIIFAIGGIHNTLSLDGEEEFYGDGISFCATCDGPVYTHKDVAIIGGGNSAMDFAISLSKYCNHVTIIHRRNSFRASNDMIEKVKKLNNVSFIMNHNVKSFDKNLFKGKFDLTLIDEKGNDTLLDVDGMFYALGFKNNTIPCEFKNDIGIFSCGDMNINEYMQVVTAAGSGCIAAKNCSKYLNSFN